MSGAAQVLDYELQHLSTEVGEVQTGFATYYAMHFEGRRTASGSAFRHDALVAAHPSLPFGTLVRVTNVLKGHSVMIRVTDRGPGTGPRTRGVIIDLSRAAAAQLNMLHSGRVRVKVEVLASNNKVRWSKVHTIGSELDSFNAATPENLALQMDLSVDVSGLSGIVATRQCELGLCWDLPIEALERNTELTLARPEPLLIQLNR